MRRDKDYFGNLINEINKPYSLREVQAKAIPQKARNSYYRVYIYNDEYLVCKVLGAKIVDYTVLGEVEEYRGLYTNDRSNLKDQLLWHGASLLEGIGIGY